MLCYEPLMPTVLEGLKKAHYCDDYLYRKAKELYKALYQAVEKISEWIQQSLNGHINQ